MSSKQLASTANCTERQLRHVLVENRDGYVVPAGGSVIDGKVELAGFDLTGMSIYGKPLPNVDFSDATIDECIFDRGITSGQLRSTRSYVAGKLRKTKFHRVDLPRLRFLSQGPDRMSIRGLPPQWRQF